MKDNIKVKHNHIDHEVVDLFTPENSCDSKVFEVETEKKKHKENEINKKEIVIHNLLQTTVEVYKEDDNEKKSSIISINYNT